MGSGAASDSKPVRLPDCSHSNPTPAHVDSGPGRPTVFAAPASGNQERAGNAIPCLDRCYPLWLEDRQARPENLHSHGVLRQEPMWWPLPSPTPQRQVPPVEPRQLLPLSLPCTVQWGLHLPSSPILGPTFLSRSVSPQIFALHTFLTLSFPFPNHCLPRPQQPCRTSAGFVPHPQSPNTN